MTWLLTMIDCSQILIHLSGKHPGCESSLTVETKSKSGCLVARMCQRQVALVQCEMAAVFCVFAAALFIWSIAFKLGRQRGRVVWSTVCGTNNHEFEAHIAVCMAKTLIAIAPTIACYWLLMVEKHCVSGAGDSEANFNRKCFIRNRKGFPVSGG